MLQKVIDDVGKLGPLCVAVVVYLANRRQTAWQNTSARRAAEVEDQKLRLALLERRQSAIIAITQASAQVFRHGLNNLPSATIGHVRDALDAAELVFEAEERLALANALSSIVELAFEVQRWRQTEDHAARSKLGVAAGLTFLKVGRQMDELPGRLQAAARVSQVPPLAIEKRRWWSI